MLWFTPTWHDDKTEKDRFSILYGLRIGGSCGLVRTLLTCSLHDEASAENQRRVQTHAEPWQEWKNTKFQRPKFQILHTSVNKYKDKCRSASSNHAQPYRTNIRCTLTVHLRSSAGPQPECYHGMGYLFDRTGQKQGCSTHPKFLRHIQNQQMRSTKSLLWCIYGPFLLVRSVKSSKFSWEKKPLYNCLALMERINFKNMKEKKRFPFYGWLSAAQLEPEHPCGGRKPTRELSWRESYRRRETWKGKLIRKKKKQKKKSKEETGIVFPRKRTVEMQQQPGLTLHLCGVKQRQDRWK